MQTNLPAKQNCKNNLKNEGIHHLSCTMFASKHINKKNLHLLQGKCDRQTKSQNFSVRGKKGPKQLF